MYSRFTISERNLEDSEFNLETWAQQKVGSKFNRIEATAFVSGASPVQPQGLLAGTVKTSAPSVYSRGEIGTIETAGATAITSDEIITLGETLKTEYLSNAYYVFNRFTRSYVRKLKDGQGNYLWQPSYQMGTPDELNGQRVAVFEDMPSIASGAISVAFGDIRSAYRIVDRTGMSVLKDVYTQAANGKILFHVRKRVGGGIQNFDSLKYLKQA
jgi:HK97 family phage major capsid protein